MEKFFNIIKKMKRYCKKIPNNGKICGDCKYDLFCDFFYDAPRYINLRRLRKEIKKLI